MRRVLVSLALACAASALGAAPASAAWSFELGMGDQAPRMFADPRFARVGFEHARVVTPYEVACRPNVQTYYLDEWLKGAASVGARPLVAFSFSWRRGQRWKLPSYRTYLRCFRAFLARYPQVRDFNPWNEANHSSQPTFRHPRKAAGFYNAMRRACPRCNIAAGDLLDWGNLERWFERYRPHLRGRPRLWSMHNYLDINQRRPWWRSGTRRMLRMTRGRLWITETAGIVYRRRKGNYDERRAARMTRRMFDFANRSPRITRLYAYHWQAGCELEKWDSAWFRADGSARPAYEVLIRELVRERGLGEAALSDLNPPLGPEIYDACAAENGTDE
jgi:hypothetical protein